MNAIEAITDGYARGWSFTKLNGKRPVFKDWTTKPRASLQDVVSWLPRYNVGLRTGAVSGVYVIDVDIAKGADPTFIDRLPTTVTVARGENRHLYFRHPGNLGNSAGKLGKHIDTRGDGGQVVFVGSVHPATGLRYEYVDGLSPADVDLADLPAWVLDKLQPDAIERTATAPVSDRYAEAAIAREALAVQTATDGTRNNTLNRAAFNLGQLVAAGALSRERVVDVLSLAADGCGLPADEAEATIRSGLAAGAASPRIRTSAAAPVAPPPSPVADYVLIPGSHVTDTGEYLEVGNDDFANTVIGRLPRDAMYRRDTMVGELIRGADGRARFEPLTADRVRLIVDAAMSLGRWFRPPGKDSTPTIGFVPCGKDHGGVVLSHAAADRRIRQLRMVTSYPCYGPGFTRLEPGWNECGVYYDEPAELKGVAPIVDLDEIRERLEDLVIDFPFSNEASRQNYYGLLVTAIVRPAIAGNIPFHLITSSLERTGKTKLAEEILGGIILGYPTPAMQLTASEEERDKRILALLLRGHTIVHLDNLPPWINSASLASLLTTATFQGRVLGASRVIDVPNNAILVGTGNNVQFSGELAKRTIPIELQPESGSPERRVDFAHPDLREYVRLERRNVYACLLGLVHRWVCDGCRPRRASRLGGFEAWSETVGGILWAGGYREWRANVEAWARDANPGDDEMIVFVEKWFARYGEQMVSVATLLDLATEIDVFSHVTGHGSGRSCLSAFGRKILGRSVNKPVGRWVIQRARHGDGVYYRLCDTTSGGAPQSEGGVQ